MNTKSLTRRLAFPLILSATALSFGADRTPLKIEQFNNSATTTPTTVVVPVKSFDEQERLVEQRLDEQRNSLYHIVSVNPDFYDAKDKTKKEFCNALGKYIDVTNDYLNLELGRQKNLGHFRWIEVQNKLGTLIDLAKYMKRDLGRSSQYNDEDVLLGLLQSKKSIHNLNRIANRVAPTTTIKRPDGSEYQSEPHCIYYNIDTNKIPSEVKTQTTEQLNIFKTSVSDLEAYLNRHISGKSVQ